MLPRLPRTQRQKEVYDYIVSFLERRGHIPTYAQIAKQLGVTSRATIAKHVQALVRLGLLEIIRTGNSSQIVIKQQEQPSSELFCEIAMAGYIAAGQPIELVESSETISVPRFMLGRVRPENVYAARIKGDSMIDEHICDGDIALIEQRKQANNGEIVMVLVDDAYATLKRIYQHGAEVELRPANSTLESMKVPASSVKVQGVFKGLLRESR